MENDTSARLRVVKISGGLSRGKRLVREEIFAGTGRNLLRQPGGGGTESLFDESLLHGLDINRAPKNFRRNFAGDSENLRPGRAALSGLWLTLLADAVGWRSAAGQRCFPDLTDVTQPLFDRMN